MKRLSLPKEALNFCFRTDESADRLREEVANSWAKEVVSSTEQIEMRRVSEMGIIGDRECWAPEKAD